MNFLQRVDGEPWCCAIEILKWLYYLLTKAFLLPVFIFLILFACVSYPASSQKSTTPNVILIFLDDMGNGDLGRDRGVGISNTSD